jgi:hypothetical protein
MKLFAMSLDQNDRSTVGFIDVKMQKLGDLESISAKQDGIECRVGYRVSYTHARTSPEFDAPGGPFEMHTGGPPHFVARMWGSTENTMQDGSVFRNTAGDFLYVRPGCLHNSNQLGVVPGVVFNLLLPGTEDDTGPLVLK